MLDGARAGRTRDAGNVSSGFASQFMAASGVENSSVLTPAALHPAAMRRMKRSATANSGLTMAQYFHPAWRVAGNQTSLAHS